MRRATALLLALAALWRPSPAGADDAELDRARRVFMTYCSTCHGEQGNGRGPVGVTLPTPPRDFTKGEFKYGSTDLDLFQTITNGAASKGGSPLMAPWGAVISDADRRGLVRYVRTLKK